MRGTGRGDRVAKRRGRQRAPDDMVFRAIADPTRRQIIALLSVGRRSVGDIARYFPVSRPAISKHLRLLRKAGLVVDEPEGTARMCHLNAEPLRQLEDWLEMYRRYWTDSLQRLKAYVEREP